GKDSVQAQIFTSAHCKVMGASIEKIQGQKEPYEHLYDYDEICYVIDGPIKWTTEDGKTIVGDTGDMVLMTKGTKCKVEIPYTFMGFSVEAPPIDVIMEGVLERAAKAK
ncbi:MAG: DUF861 domain-containing protein, partial [Deltaproteobacteria bacterium]|nr:DUF861 domain-containing protein [Deltaproteobacteria bacterium]